TALRSVQPRRPALLPVDGPGHVPPGCPDADLRAALVPRPGRPQLQPLPRHAGSVRPSAGSGTRRVARTCRPRLTSPPECASEQWALRRYPSPSGVPIRAGNTLLGDVEVEGRLTPSQLHIPSRLRTRFRLRIRLQIGIARRRNPTRFGGHRRRSDREVHGHRTDRGVEGGKADLSQPEGRPAIGPTTGRGVTVV